MSECVRHQWADTMHNYSRVYGCLWKLCFWRKRELCSVVTRSAFATPCPGAQVQEMIEVRKGGKTYCETCLAMLGSELLEEAWVGPASTISRSAYALAVQEVAAVILSWGIAVMSQQREENFSEMAPRLTVEAYSVQCYSRSLSLLELEAWKEGSLAKEEATPLNQRIVDEEDCCRRKSWFSTGHLAA